MELLHCLSYRSYLTNSIVMNIQQCQKWLTLKALSLASIPDWCARVVDLVVIALVRSGRDGRSPTTRVSLAKPCQTLLPLWINGAPSSGVKERPALLRLRRALVCNFWGSTPERWNQQLSSIQCFVYCSPHLCFLILIVLTA